MPKKFENARKMWTIGTTTCRSSSDRECFAAEFIARCEKISSRHIAALDQPFSAATRIANTQG
jgi:hypothetical protein